jgi:hypothetical protein
VGLRLFVYLAIIEFAWVMLVTIIQGRSLGEVLGAFVPKMIGFSFFYWIMVDIQERLPDHSWQSLGNQPIAQPLGQGLGR